MPYSKSLAWLIAPLLSLISGAASALDMTFKTVAPGVYAYIGDTGLRSAANEGMNSNVGFIVTGAGVVVVDSGSTWNVARQIHAAIQKVTREPVKYVINTGGQDHRWLGNGYFKSLGAEIIAQRKAADDMQERSAIQLRGLESELKEKLKGTEPVYPTRLFDTEDELHLGNFDIRLLWFGGAHTPGDIAVWLPKSRIVFAGDIVFVDRLIAVLPFSNVKASLDSFAGVEKLDPKIIVPGHGDVCDLAKARKETRDYLAMLRNHMKEAIKNSVDLQSAIDSLDQNPYKYLANWELLKGGNASRAYLEAEAEW